MEAPHQVATRAHTVSPIKVFPLTTRLYWDTKDRGVRYASLLFLGNMFASNRKILLPVLPFVAFIVKAINMQLGEREKINSKEYAQEAYKLQRTPSNSFDSKTKSQAASLAEKQYSDSSSSDTEKGRSGNISASKKTAHLSQNGCEKTTTSSSTDSTTRDTPTSSVEEIKLRSSQEHKRASPSTTDKILLQLVIFASNLVHHGSDLGSKPHLNLQESKSTKDRKKLGDKGKENERKEDWLEEKQNVSGFLPSNETATLEDKDEIKQLLELLSKLATDKASNVVAIAADICLSNAPSIYQ